jgi:hypothetical protein
MKLLNAIALSFVTLLLLTGSIFALLTGSIFAQETQSETGAFRSSGTSGRDIFAEKPAGEPAGLISASRYPFSVLAGIGLEDMSTGATELIPGGTDNDSSVLSPIGFLFRFDAVNYTTFGANGNGFIRLGGAAAGPANSNAVNSTGNSAKIMPYWDDLCVGNAGRVHYKTIGEPGSRKLIVEWRDMKITRAGSCNGVGGGNFQLWISEGSGAVQFVYGNGMIAAANDGGYSAGLQSGPASNFASITTSVGTVDYAAANNGQISAISAGTSYLFSPNIPAAPTNGSITGLTQTSLQLNWTDNANDETVYLVRRSTDNINFTVAAELPPNTSSFFDSGLTPATQYFYIVNAASDGGLSANLTFSATTNPIGNIASTASGGPWSAPSTWVGGVIPAAGDNVTITNGSTVVIDATAAALSVSVGTAGSLAESKDAFAESMVPATLTFNETAPFSLTVTNDLTITPNGIFATSGTGSETGHVLNLNANLINNGVLDFSTNTAGAIINFTGASNNTFSGIGPTTDVRTIIVNKGTTNATILELSVSNFTVRGSATDTGGSGYLILAKGTFKISGTFSGSHRTFSNSNYIIAANTGIWLNNPNYTVAGQNGSPGVVGLFRVSAGTYNVGVTTNNSLGFFMDANIIIEGGSVNTTGRFGVLNIATRIIYNQSGGTVTTCTVGQFSNSLACFDMGGWRGADGSITMSGGDIVIQNPTQIADGPRDYQNLSGLTGLILLTGTTVHFGNSLTSTPGTFSARGYLPKVVIDTSAGANTLQFLEPAVVNNRSRDMNIEPGGTLDTSNGAYFMEGANLINNGVIKANGPNSALYFSRLGNNTVYSGSGVSTGVMTDLLFNCQSVTFSPGINNIRVRNIRVFAGNIINANELTLGNNDAEVSTVSFGGLGSPTAGGTFDSAPVFDLGTGGEIVAYLRTAAPQTTGPEINPARILKELTYDDANVLTINGGDLTVTDTLRLTNGEVNTGPGRITVHSQVARSNGYVNGTFNWRFTSTGFQTWPIGQNGIYLPVQAAIPALGTNPSFLSIRMVDQTLPGLLPATSVSRYWKLEEVGDVSASLLFKYADADVNGNEANYTMWRSNGGTPVLVGGTADPSNNTVGTPFGVTDLTGDWGAGSQLDPGPVSIGGSVTQSGGQPIANALVTISGGNLPAPIQTQTGSFGLYQFNNLQAGETYTVRVDVKRYRFSVNTQQVTPLGNVSNVNFVANPQ